MSRCGTNLGLCNAFSSLAPPALARTRGKPLVETSASEFVTLIPAGRGGGRVDDGSPGSVSDQPATSIFLARRAREFCGYAMTRHKEAER
jgi:hypothetical protein